MNKKLTFIRETNGEWYVKLKWWPKILRPMLQMVAGADVFLEKYYIDVAKDSKSNLETKDLWLHSTFYITLAISERPFDNYDDCITLNNTLNTEAGLTFWHSGRFYNLQKADLVLFAENRPHLKEFLFFGNNIWICNVIWILYFFRYPKKLWFKSVKTNIKVSINY